MCKIYCYNVSINKRIYLLLVSTDGVPSQLSLRVVLALGAEGPTTIDSGAMKPEVVLLWLTRRATLLRSKYRRVSYGLVLERL